VAYTSVCTLCHGANRPPISDSRRQIQTAPVGAGLAPPAAANPAGRNSRAELRSLSPASCHRRSNSSPRHPGIPVAQPLPAVLFLFRWEPSARVNCFELLPLAKQAGFETATSPVRTGALSWVEVTRTFTTPESLCRGNSRPERHLALPIELQQLASLAGLEPATAERSSSCLRHSANPCGGNQRPRFFVRCSATELQQLSSLAGIEPATVGSRCNPSLHHAANSLIFFFSSLRPYLFVSSSAHTRSLSLRRSHLCTRSVLKIPGGIGVHGLSGFEPEPFGLATEVTVNFTIPGNLFKRDFSRHKNYAGPEARISKLRLQFHRQAKTLERRIVLDRNDLSGQ
jgi:hypothetical protein